MSELKKTIFNTPFELLDNIGKQLGVSPWLLIEQSRINQFADATGDHQWIHVDEEKSKQGPYGTCIAHGYLTMSLVNYFLPQIIEIKGISRGVNYGTNKVRFPAVVRVGSHVRAHAQLLAAEELKGGIQTVIQVTVEVKDSDKPACVVETVSRYYPVDKV